jgi:hydroxymethylbilane synthase
MVRAALCATHGWAEDDVAIVPIRTTGDRVQDRALAEIGGKALWTKELDRALLDGEIECVIRIAAMLPRADVRDRLIGAVSIDSLPQKARIGTSSPRRAAQLRRLRPDLQPMLFRGNVDTRLAKLAAGEVDATLLAAAGLDRLGRAEIGVAIPTDVMLPAPAQGAVGIEARAADRRVLDWLAAISHAPTLACVLLERALLAALHADCHSPVAGLATLEDAGASDQVTIRAELLAEDGSAHVTGSINGHIADPDIARALADDLLARAPPSVRRLFAA